jgi:hypothetical protein
VRLIVHSALECSPVCDRSPVTALEFHGARDEVMAVREMREMRVYVECARSHGSSITGFWARTHCALDLDSARTIAVVLDRSSCVVERTNRDLTHLISILPFKLKY